MKLVFLFSKGGNHSWMVLCLYPWAKWGGQKEKWTFLATTVALLFQNNVPNFYWVKALLIVTYIINRLANKVLDFKNPVSLLSQFFLDFNTFNNLILRIFGCPAFVHNHSFNRSKLDLRAIQVSVFRVFINTKRLQML